MSEHLQRHKSLKRQKKRSDSRSLRFKKLGKKDPLLKKTKVPTLSETAASRARATKSGSASDARNEARKAKNKNKVLVKKTSFISERTRSRRFS